MIYPQTTRRDGLGLPIVPIVMAAVSAVGAIVGSRRRKPKVTREEAKRAVQAIYLELLSRDPWDPYDAGAEGYVNCLVEGWCDVDFVRTEVLKAPEYRDVEMRRAAQVYGLAPGASAGISPVPTVGGGLAPSLAPVGGPLAPAGGIPSEVFGIPIVYLIGGVALLMLMRR